LSAHSNFETFEFDKILRSKKLIGRDSNDELDETNYNKFTNFMKPENSRVSVSD
jgi:hypothetical protein